MTAFQTDDAASLLVLMHDLTDETRLELWDGLRRPLNALEVPAGYGDWTVEARSQRMLTRAITSLAIGPVDVVRILGARVLPPDFASIVDRVLVTRGTEWLDGFTTSTLHTFASEPEVGLMGPFWTTWWQHIRQRERSGLLQPDQTSADYLVLMVRGLLFSGSVVDGVRADPALIERSIWSLFEPGPGVQKALLGAEKFWDPGSTWRVALVRLALEGTLDRDRLVDAAAAAASDERMGRNHRAWYRRIPALIADPSLLPEPSGNEQPPPGNQLRQLS